MEYKRYDVVMVDFGVVVGSEQGKIRPALIVQNDIGNKFSSTTIVMPLTSEIKHLSQPTHTLIRKGKHKGLSKDSMVLGECIRQVSEMRIIEYLGSITDKDEQEEIRRVYWANIGD